MRTTLIDSESAGAVYSAQRFQAPLGDSRSQPRSSRATRVALPLGIRHTTAFNKGEYVR